MKVLLVEPYYTGSHRAWAARIRRALRIYRQVCFEKLGELLATFPDMRHGHLMKDVESRAEVLPVGVDLLVCPRTGKSPVPRILWNRRWEHDKDPEAFADAVEHLTGRDADLELASDRIVHDGEAPTPTYRKLVASSDIVVSASRQESLAYPLSRPSPPGAGRCFPTFCPTRG